MKLKTTILCLTVSIFSATVFVSCDQKKDKEGAGKPDAEEAAASDNADILTDQLIVLMDKLADTMLTATDKPAAEAAGKKIEGIADELEALAQRFDKLDTPSEEEQAKLDAKMTKAMNAMETRMEGANKLFENQEVAAALGAAMAEFGERMEKCEPIFERFGKTR